MLYLLVGYTWKDKILDYEIETKTRRSSWRFRLTWKDKILDYEIETTASTQRRSPNAFLEKIRFSITRLKRQMRLCQPAQYLLLEKIRFSITRLKLRSFQRMIIEVFTWKDKILDYEIET